ncbi:MAG TPA: protein phosphatase 2C domain-containing protein [Phycicoccus sp.]|jgi:serine/threonine protein phosphatase PrpC|nr:protein phosphatase 2C domain-containing protein [Phycicoccus sp.]
MTSAILDVVSAGMSDAGRHRERNEDSFLTARPVFLVADGLGGHARGEAASSAVVEAFTEIAGRDWLTSEQLLEIIGTASARVRALDSGAGAPGSTVSGVALTHHGGVPCWLVFNIGDSRTYLLEDGQLSQLTVDHAAVRQVGGDAGLTRNVITRAIGAGIERPPMADQWLVPAREGQRILICSDGLTNEVTDPLIQASLMSASDPQSAASLLVEAALEAGGRDNVTVVVVDAVTVRAAPVGMAERDGETIPDVTESDDVPVGLTLPQAREGENP